MRSFESVLSELWWAPIVRGVAAVLFGVIAIVWPGVTLAALILLFGAFAVVDGIAAIIIGITEHGDRERWWATLIAGIVSVAAGVLTFLMPGITALALLVLIASWAIVRGAFDIAASIRLRDAIEGEWLLALVGVLSIAFGVLMLVFPGAGALAVILWIGAFAIASGIILIALGFRMRGVTRVVQA